MIATAMDKTRFDLTLMRLHPRTMPAALERVRRWLEGRPGQLIACLYSDIGTVNQLLLLRRFADAADLLAERDAALRERDPFGVSEFSLGLSMDLWAALPGIPAPGQPARGPLFELRTDRLKPGRLARALAAWGRAEPGLMPAAGFFTLAADAPQIVHLWPWSSDAGRIGPSDADSPTDIAGRLGGAENLAAQRTELFRAAAFSPLQ
ncbi:hypothetical protein DWF00_01870 [Bosea caraganae]|uniref:NIPSNAP domain-containing protein n=1 Tax=Bosea caraganae TaxID=2763117 RepID=A0A370L9M0_9HYPH|nr:NIPSNAP family protein [Bosea caraganae]RDJ26946.1 hypothetical protein DWE98_08890 [Bosea caraganae]RDJ30833.1 hypothetical protein DWF00_01870 [Bosea caraganae]